MRMVTSLWAAFRHYPQTCSAPPDGNVTDIASLQQTLREWMAANKTIVDEVKLVIGFGYDNSKLKELRHPTRDDLDAVSKDLAVVIVHQSGHLGSVNSKALEILWLHEGHT